MPLKKKKKFTILDWIDKEMLLVEDHLDHFDSEDTTKHWDIIWND